MKIVLVFPGFGSQYVGMGKELYDEYRIVQEYFEEASSCSPINFIKLCFASSDLEISKLVNAYSSLFLMGGAVFALLKEQGIVPAAVAGYNNGETAALLAAGSFSMPDGLYLLNKMCSFFQETLDITDVEVMHIVGRTTEQLKQDCSQIDNHEESLFISFYTSEIDHVVVGSHNAVSLLRDAIELYNGVKINYLSPEVGLHCKMMKDVISQFKIYLEKVDFKDVTIPIISGIDGALITQGLDIRERFIRHINEPFRFDNIVQELANYDMIIVITPAEQLGKLLKEEYPEKVIVTVDKKSDIELLKELVGLNV